MAANLTFYTHPMSRGRIARWMLEELGQPYETVLLEYGASMKGADYLAINPMGKVPAIRHGEVVVTECAAICAYLADAFPQAGLAPPVDSPLRGAYYRWLFFAAGPVEQYATNKALGFVAPEERKGMVGYGDPASFTDTLVMAVKDRTYLVGDRFSAADVYLGAQIGWGLAFNTLEKRPELEAYYAGLAKRPAAIRAKEIDDALLPKPG